MAPARTTSAPPFPLGAPFELHCGRYRLSVSDGRSARFDVAVTNTPHRHLHYFEICLVVSGHGDYEHGGKHYPLGPGAVFIADPDVAHEISSRETRDLFLRFWNLVIKDAPLSPGGSWEEQVTAAFLEEHEVCAMPGVPLLPCLPLLSHSPGRGGVALRHRENLMLEMLAALTRHPPSDRVHVPPEDSAVGRALDHIRRNLHKPLPAEELAAVANMSVRNLALRMKKTLGRTIHGVVLEQRLSHAAQLLGQHFKVQEVARMVGVEDAGQFTRMFTRRFGLAPKKFQARHFGEEAPVYTFHEGKSRTR